MVVGKGSLVDMYIITLRVAQPARLVDVLNLFSEVWGEEVDEELAGRLAKIHDNMKSTNRIKSVRKGTYVLDSHGMTVAAKLIKERTIDNARIFLMKRQRKDYR